MLRSVLKLAGCLESLSKTQIWRRRQWKNTYADAFQSSDSRSATDWRRLVPWSVCPRQSRRKSRSLTASQQRGRQSGGEIEVSRCHLARRSFPPIPIPSLGQTRDSESLHARRTTER